MHRYLRAERVRSQPILRATAAQTPGGEAVFSCPLGCLQNNTTVISAATAALSAPSPWHLSGLSCQNTQACADHTGEYLVAGEERGADVGRALPGLIQCAFLSTWLFWKEPCPAW